MCNKWEKNIAWSNKSPFLLQHLDSEVRIWREQRKGMDSSCFVPVVQAAAAAAENIFFA